MKYVTILILLMCHSFAGVDTTLITQQKGVIWGFDFIDKENIIFTIHSGKIGIFNIKSKNTSWQKVPNKIYSSGQGGLLDLKVYKQNVYLTYSEQDAKDDDEATTALALATYKDKKLSLFKKIFTANAMGDTSRHFGSRLEIVSDHLFMTIGDRGQRHKAQDLKVHNGKILRLKLDGSLPTDNPFASSYVWSYGHRNPQGIVYDHKNKILYNCEFGPRGGDEVDIVNPKKNYGWPVITYGKEYWGPSIGTTHKKGMEQPLLYYVPSISPSGMAIYQGNLYLAALGDQHIQKIVFDQGKVKSQAKLLKSLNERFRVLRLGPDGKLYASTDSGKILLLNL